MSRRSAVVLAISMMAILSNRGTTDSANPRLYPVRQQGKYGFIDSTGRIIILPQFEDASSFSDGLAMIRRNQRTGFIDSTGRVLFEANYDHVEDFSEGFAVVSNGEKRDPHIGLVIEPGQWGFVDRNGKLAIPLQFTHADGFSEGLAAVGLGHDSSGFIDPSGKLVFTFSITVSWGFHDSLALVRNPEATLFVTRQGAVLPTPRIDDYEARSFSEGLAAVSIKGKWGFIDRTGRLVIPARFEDADDFHEGWAAVRFSADESRPVHCAFPGDSTSSHTATLTWGFIDREGHTVIPGQFESVGAFAGGLANVLTCSRSTFVDRSGRTVFGTEFESGGGFNGPLAAVVVYRIKGNRWGYINRAGRVVWEPSE